ncbi:hypothetical protein HPC49_09790 [Pyxidicoccus fallax]|uniref:Major facilitator superfamily (MFS) profile domain-containing protein n=1 Tax=Pyxidicoccus fallax TaxID=394095 RepID=A0A848L479_9BACT|nr:hypothetical protein [Pyxidicoccus fallax]NMO13514.1 hypothetical protein [Pyxidicoccus fallax]NPC78535.1 hypothetical protein [Pyxidicoccus fallax]
MHTLLLLSAVLFSLPPAADAPIPARLEALPALTLPDSQRGTLHLLDTKSFDEDYTQNTGSRVVFELLAGIGTSTAISAASYLVLTEYPRFELMVTSLLLLAVGPGLAVSLTGEAMDGRGSHNYAMLGSVMGFMAPALLGTVLVLGCESHGSTPFNELSQCSPLLIPLALAIGLLPAVGATLAYETSAPRSWLSQGHASGSAPPAPRFVPVLTLTGRGLGGTVGIAGSL